LVHIILYGNDSACIDPEVKRSKVRITQLRKLTVALHQCGTTRRFTAYVSSLFMDIINGHFSGDFYRWQCDDCRKAARTEDDEYKTQNQTYYNIAHSSAERVLEQPGLLVGGTLKEYQVTGDILLRKIVYVCSLSVITQHYAGIDLTREYLFHLSMFGVVSVIKTSFIN